MSVLMNSVTLNNSAGSVIFPDNIQSGRAPRARGCEGNIDVNNRTDTCFAQSSVAPCQQTLGISEVQKAARIYYSN